MSILAKDIKSMKKYDCVVIRFDGQFGTDLEFSNRDNETKSIIHDSAPTHFRGCIVYMFANHYDTSWQFFVNALKNSDQVSFSVRDNSNQFVQEMGMITEEVRGKIARKVGDRTKHLETTLQSHTVKEGNCTLLINQFAGRIVLTKIEDDMANQAASYVKLPKYASQADRDLDELDFTH